MPLVDLDKTSYKFKDVLWFISGALLVAGGIWRFEYRMDKSEESMIALETKLMYKYEMEILKINNRMDLIEAREIANKTELKSDTLSLDSKNTFSNKRTNNGRNKRDKYPQVCMVMPRTLELRKLKLPNIKNLKHLV